MSLEPQAWAEIARLWIEGTEPLGRIGVRFGVSHQRIVGQARREGWPERGGRAADGLVCGGGATGRLAGDASAQGSAGCGAETEPASPSGKPDGEAGRRGDAAAAGEAPRKRNRTAVRRAMVERLFDAMDVKLSALEERIAAGGDSSPADSERTTRALNTLVRSLEKLADYEGKIGKGKGRRHDKPRTAAADAERRRSELARRIQRLLDSR